jgi:hypothetical protein
MELEKVCVIGMGTMGRQIGIVCAQKESRIGQLTGPLSAFPADGANQRRSFRKFQVFHPQVPALVYKKDKWHHTGFNVFCGSRILPWQKRSVDNYVIDPDTPVDLSGRSSQSEA